MKPYRALAVIRLFDGVVGLSDEQAKRRTSYLTKIGDNLYQIKGEICFKSGEVVGLDSVPKPYANLLECLETEAVSDVDEKELKKPVVKRKRRTSKSKA